MASVRSVSSGLSGRVDERAHGNGRHAPSAPMDGQPSVTRPATSRGASNTPACDTKCRSVTCQWGQDCGRHGVASASSATPAVELAAFALGRTAGAALALGGPWELAGGWRWRVIDVALGRERCRDPRIDDPGHLDDPVAPVHVRLDAVADPDLGRRFGDPSVDAHVSTAAAGRRVGSGLVQPDRPQPTVDSGAVHGCRPRPRNTRGAFGTEAPVERGYCRRGRYIRVPTGAVVGVSTVSRSSLGSSGNVWLW
jgi:hypothetical protein